MQQYYITGYDYTTPNALQHRMDIRPQHIETVRALRQNGNYVLGGAILNDAGQMIGSVLVLQFETEAQLHHWRDNEPYVVNKVWEKVEIKPFKVANLD